VSLPSARLQRFDNGVTAVDTEYVRPQLDASHLIEQGGRAAFVDTGSNDSVPLLLDALAQLRLSAEDVDYVFLTHVHLDHAGGAGLLMQKLPRAKAVIHPRGAPHMIDPSKLIAGSIAVYGEAEFHALYGELVPIDEARVVIAGDGDVFDLGGRKLRAFYTEGHARHHYCLDDPASKGVFTGDSFGISLRDFDTGNGAFIFPATTPVHFDPDEAHRSVDRILACDPDCVYLTHYSRVTNVEKLGSDMHRRIDDFVALAERYKDSAARTETMRAAMFDYLTGELREHGCVVSGDTMAAQLEMDVGLNVMGLEYWLDNRKAS
jgi:glyoxylase-like metal-dependent hydrolase (beta-lactamase superfamily II)